MIIDGWFKLLEKVILIARRDRLSKNPHRSLDAELFLIDFLEGLEAVSN